MRLKKLHSLAAMMIASVTLLTGCVRYRAELEVTKKGTMSFSMLYAMNTEAMSESLNGLGGTTSTSSGLNEEQIAEYKENGFDVTDYNESGYKGFRISKENFDPNEERKKAESSDYSGLETIDKQIRFEKNKKGNYEIEITLNDLYGGEDSAYVASLSGAIKEMGGFMEVVVKLPCKAASSNATKVEDNTLTWDLLSMSENSIFIELDKRFGMTLLFARYGWVIAIAGVLLILLLIRFVAKKRRNSFYGY